MSNDEMQTILTRLDKFQEWNDTRFESLEGRIDGVESSIGKLTRKVDSLETKVDSLGLKMDEVLAAVNGQALRRS